MEQDTKIHLPKRKTNGRSAAGTCTEVQISLEAYNALVLIYNNSSLPMSEIASRLILESRSRIVYDEEG